MQFLCKVSIATRHALFVALLSSTIGLNLAAPAIGQDVITQPVLDSMHDSGSGGAGQKMPPSSKSAVPPPSSPTTYDGSQNQNQGPDQDLDQEQGAGKAKPRLFGSQLFTQPTIVAQLQSTNPNYLMDTGDRVSINVWGGISYTGMQTIDAEGNIFLPEVGPIHLGGKPSAQLNEIIRGAASRVFTENVGTYATLLTRQPIGVFVTGAVKNPGRYAGESKGSLIGFLAQAGGVDEEAGSFRDIRILRDQKVIARIDLYNFLLEGTMPPIALLEDDTILVGAQGTTVSADGEVKNSYRFEVATTGTTGRDLMYLARPKSNVAYVSVRGVRSGNPFSAYLPLQQFLATPLVNGDEYSFLADGVDDTIFVSVTGQSTGSSRLAVPRNARLGDVLKYIKVDPETADIDSIYLRRKSVARQQAHALQLSLNELQRSVLTGPAATEGDAQVRAQEAALVEQFVSQARLVHPEGRVVLAGNASAMRTTLEPDDEIVIPTKSNLILISGEVRLPQTVLYEGGKSISGYASAAGGFTERADTSNFVVIRRSGAVETGGRIAVQPGDNIMVMPEVGTHGFVVFKEVIGVLYQIAIAAAVTLDATGF
jgi:protein involved in polysaccharide export with SLBB domain